MLAGSVSTSLCQPLPSPPPHRSSVVGTWRFQVIGGAAFEGLATFGEGGTLIFSDGLAHASRLPGIKTLVGSNFGTIHGSWKRIGRNRFSFRFRNFIFADQDAFGLPLNLSEPLTSVGQHIGSQATKGTIVMRGNDKFDVTGMGELLNRAGMQLTPAFPKSPFTMTARRDIF